VPGALALRACRDGALTMRALPGSEVTRDAIHLLRNRSRSALVAAFVDMLRGVASGYAETSPANSAASGDPAR
jgi:hypothetical protein